MKIFLISNMYPSSKYPVYGIFVKNFVENLSNKHNVTFVLSVIKGKRKSILSKLTTYIFHYLEIIYKGIFSSYNIIYLHYISHSTLPVLILKLFSNKKLVINAHGSDVIANSLVLKVSSFYIKKLVKYSDCIVVPSNYYQSVIMKKYNINENKFYISPSGGINNVLFQPFKKKKIKKKFTIGYVSRIDKGKGWDIFLDAIIKISSILSFRAIIVGDGDERIKMLNKIKENNIGHLIEDLGLIPQRDLPNIYNKFDIFVFPTLRKAESLGLVGLESMSCGVPVIGSNIGGPSEYIDEGKNGYKFETGNASELASKIIFYSKLPSSEINLMKKNCINTAKRYDNNLVTQNLYKKIDSLICKK